MERIEKTESEWKDLLTEEEYEVLRSKGTEPPFNNAFWDNHEEGTYSCAACGQLLFSSEDKFDSGTGWPSFTKPLEEEYVEVTGDESYGMVRDEILCARCQSHLGHIFPDGPRPLGTRYCMNSVCLRFDQA